MDIRVVLLIAIFALAMAIKPATADAHHSSSGSGGGGGGGGSGRGGGGGGGGGGARFFSGGGGGAGAHEAGHSSWSSGPPVKASANPPNLHIEIPSAPLKIENNPSLSHETPKPLPVDRPRTLLPALPLHPAREHEPAIEPVSFHPIKFDRPECDDAYWHRHHRRRWYQPVYFENAYAEESFWEYFLEQLMLAMLFPDPAASAAMVPPPDFACDLDGQDCVPIGWYQGEFNSPEFYFNPDPGESLDAYRDRVAAALTTAKARLNDARARSDTVEEATLEDAITSLNERMYTVEDHLGLAITPPPPGSSGLTHY